MFRTYVFGRLYFSTCIQPTGAPRFDRAVTHELGGLLRVGDSVAIRLGKNFAVIVGWWRK